jgi:hypothetical protein
MLDYLIIMKLTMIKLIILISLSLISVIPINEFTITMSPKNKVTFTYEIEPVNKLSAMFKYEFEHLMLRKRKTYSTLLIPDAGDDGFNKEIKLNSEEAIEFEKVLESKFEKKHERRPNKDCVFYYKPKIFLTGEDLKDLKITLAKIGYIQIIKEGENFT